MKVKGYIPWQAKLTPAAQKMLAGKGVEAALFAVRESQGLALHTAQFEFNGHTLTYSSRMTLQGVLHVDIDVGTEACEGLIVTGAAARAAELYRRQASARPTLTCRARRG
jgi:hypothetical protein